jgi:hypothetical protein
MEYRKRYALTSILCLISGSMIYVCYRPESLLMFHLFQTAGISDEIHMIRDAARPIGRAFPEWANHSLPYAMWVFSYMLAQRSIWYRSEALESYFWILAAPAIAIISEFAQAVKMIPGTFDWIDLVMLAIAATVGCRACFPQKPLTDVQRQIEANRISNVVDYFYRLGRRKRRY